MLLIWYCISIVRFSISVNGSLIGFFNSSRRLRQCDHLSKFFVIIVMELFIRMISIMVASDFMTRFSIGDTNLGTLNISYLLFAFDIL